MALIKMGSIVSDISGSLAGHTLQQSHYGLQLRTKPCYKPQPSNSQYLIRSSIKRLQGLWGQLTSSQRNNWNLYSPKPLAGHSYFIKYNMYLLSIGYVFINNFPFYPSKPWLYSYPLLLSYGDTFGFYDSLDLSTIAKTPDNYVSQWSDKLLSVRNLIQPAADRMPLFSPSGILFDGTSDFMAIPAFSLLQPFTFYMVFSFVSWTYGSYIMRSYQTYSTYWRQHPSIANRIIFYAGGTGLGIPVSSVGIPFLFRNVFNYANSYARCNLSSKIIGNIGSNGIVYFILGTSTSGSSWSNILVKELIIRNIADTDSDSAIIADYLNKKYSIW